MADFNREKATEAQIVAEARQEGGGNEAVLGDAEPWETWETKLCLWSLGIGIVALVVLGFLVNQFLLP